MKTRANWQQREEYVINWRHLAPLLDWKKIRPTDTIFGHVSGNNESLGLTVSLSVLLCRALTASTVCQSTTVKPTASQTL